MKKAIWISWNYSQRSRNLAHVMNIPLYVLEIENNLICRHLISSIWTLYILLKIKPTIVYMQYSFLLLILVDIYKLLFIFKVKIICDCHTKAIKRKMTGVMGIIFKNLKSYSFILADLSIISNTGLIPEISKYTKNYYILNDKIPKQIINKKRKTRNYSVFICSYAPDEPLEEVIKASMILSGKTNIMCTGRIPKNLQDIKKRKFNNIHFTDYLEYERYMDLVSNAICLIALTTEEDCLQCGGYEGLSIGVPIVVTDTRAMREYFGNSAVFVKNESKEIAEGVVLAIKNCKKLKYNMKKIKESREKEFERRVSRLKHIVSDLV